MVKSNLISCQVDKEFLDLFTHDIVDEDIGDGNPAKLNLFTLQISNNNFIYNELINDLENRIITFCLPRKRYGEYIKKGHFGSMASDARRKLRDYTANEGEAGEILLYCFLESYLNAPKLLTKYDIKTSSNDYVKGADGVHVLELGPTNFQVVFGEAKLYKSLNSSIYEAFKSINCFIERKKNNVFHETQLIIGELEKECINDFQYEFIKAILVPQKSKTFSKDNAFGIFAGFNIDLTDEEKKLGNKDFRKLIETKVSDEFRKYKPYVKNQIDKYELWGYSFYIYIVPFINIDLARKDIIAQLQGFNDEK